MMAQKDPYSVLGVSKGASDGEIKRAFRKKARQFHPDRNPDDSLSEAKFKEVQSAYDKIGDAESRREFDQKQQMANMFGGGMRGGSTFGGMGGGNQRRRPQPRQKGSDITVGLDVSMAEANEGGTFSFTFKRLKPNSLGNLEAKSVTLKTNLDAGVKHGTIKRLKGQGNDHPEGDSGDVLLTVRIDAGENRSWDGDVLIQQVQIPYSAMMLGGKVKVTLPSGKEGLLKIAPNSQIGDRRRMSKAGFLGGDLDLEFTIIEFDELTEQQKDALEQLRESGL